jgi:hypothetical protein
VIMTNWPSLRLLWWCFLGLVSYATVAKPSETLAATAA